MLTPAAVVDPYAIYDRAKAFWLTQEYAPYLTYRVAVQVTQGGTTRVEHYQSMFDATTTTGTTYVDEISDYEQEHPVYVHGMNLFFNISLYGAGGKPMQLNKPLPPIDFIGVPELTPTYSFGIAPFVRVPPPDAADSAAALIAEIREQYHDPYPAWRKPFAGPMLPTIAHVVVPSYQVYKISYAGTDVVDGHTCYHLVLEPRTEPYRYRLRDIWVDTATGATWRLDIALNFIRGPGTQTPWTIDFNNVDGVQYIDEETAKRPLHFEGQTYSRTVVSFEDVQPVNALDPRDVMNMNREPACPEPPCPEIEEPAD